MHISSHFGEHITIDGYGGNPERLNSEEAISLGRIEFFDCSLKYPERNLL
jgi:hypothetical protein